jgi:predicted dehydrogenase
VLNVAIVGCGKIADSHASQIRRVRGCQIVAACDQELLMARQLAERFQIEHTFSDVEAMLAGVKPDVVHITTPPASHFPIARLCLEHGAHVYVEKPFTLAYAEAEALIGFANTQNRLLTAGHDDQFSHVARRMRSLVGSGYLGGPPVHMESFYCYDLTDPGYARALLANKEHWVRRLPGQLLQNIISHGIARIAEFLTSERPDVIAHGFVSPALKILGEREIIDELRVIISEDERTTAYFTFSSQMRPSIHEFRLYGPSNGIILDHDHEILLKLRGKRFPSYVEKFAPPAIFGAQHWRNLLTNARTFMARDFHMKSGMKHLIESFYQSIELRQAPPIPYREILLTTRIMEDIFEQLSRSRPSAGLTGSPDRKPMGSDAEPVSAS